MCDKQDFIMEFLECNNGDYDIKEDRREAELYVLLKYLGHDKAFKDTHVLHDYITTLKIELGLIEEFYKLRLDRGH